MTNRLQGKVALITGGARGQGAAEARLFSAEGASVVICDLLEEEGRTLAAELKAAGHNARFIKLDVSKEAEWTAALDEVRDAYGRLDILVNNAGTNVRYQLMEMSLSDWDLLIAVNLTGAMLGIRASVPLMREAGRGSIVNVGSTAGLVGHPTTAYSSAKWGLRGLTKSAAYDLVSSGIRVNCMHPGLVDTPLATSNRAAFDTIAEMLPMKRGGTPEELANVALFLASDESSYITGIDLPVDGGWTTLGAYMPITSKTFLGRDDHRRETPR